MRELAIATCLIALSACATSHSGASRPDDLRSLSGSWEGTLTGSDMATASGIAALPARLTLREDGRWTLNSSGGVVVASGVARRSGDGIVLDGTVTAGDPMAVGRGLSFLLKPRGPDALYGNGETFFQGLRVDSGIMLKRA